MKSIRLYRALRRILSPPTRGAWIEMTIRRHRRLRLLVAPHTGGVD